MNKVIVTGANGFVGSAVVKYLVSQNIEVLALCRANRDSNIPRSPLVKISYMELSNIKELKKILPTYYYDTFFHFAWDGSAGSARFDTKLQLSNVQWTVDAIELAHELGCQRFVGSGSIMEHETISAGFTQGNRPGPGYIYGSGKLTAHIMGMSVAAKLNIEFIWPEITNAYGIGEVSPRLVNSTIRSCLRNQPPEFTAGTQNYDFVYIDDVARAFYLIGKNGKPFHHYIIGSSTARPLKEFLLEMQRSIAPDMEFSFGQVPFTGTNLSLDCFDCQETQRDTKFRAKISFAEGTKKTMIWLKQIGDDIHDSKV